MNSLVERVKTLRSNISCLREDIDSNKKALSYAEVQYKKKKRIVDEELKELEKYKNEVETYTEYLKKNESDLQNLTNELNSLYDDGYIKDLEKKFNSIPDSVLIEVLKKYSYRTDTSSISYLITNNETLKGKSLVSINTYYNGNITIRKSFVALLEAILNVYVNVSGNTLDDFVTANKIAAESNNLHFVCSTETNTYFDDIFSSTPSNNVIVYTINGKKIWFKQVAFSPRMFFKRLSCILKINLFNELDNKIKVDMEVK